MNSNNKIDNDTQVSDKTTLTWVANLTEGFLTDAVIGNMTKEQSNSFFMQVQLATVCVSYI